MTAPPGGRADPHQEIHCPDLVSVVGDDNRGTIYRCDLWRGHQGNHQIRGVSPETPGVRYRLEWDKTEEEE